MQLKKVAWCKLGAGTFLSPNSQNTVTDTNVQSEMVPEFVYKTRNILDGATRLPVFVCVRPQENHNILYYLQYMKPYIVLSSINSPKKNVLKRSKTS